MAVKVLVVDDSGFFRRRVSEILSADSNIQVVGTATNGKEAIDQALALKPRRDHHGLRDADDGRHHGRAAHHATLPDPGPDVLLADP
ncbi:UNVERIFIED_ORG: chemotaxis response regulator CheB [Pseudomonas reinekei]|nr:chemotaxis response regulator CheB [Pseudomonas reinekei]